MTKQTCLPGLKPSPPTIRTPSVARRIAERIVAAVNLDELYWTPEEVPDRVEDVAAEIMRCGRAATVIARLYERQSPISDNGERGTHPYGWEGIDEHCRYIGNSIAKGVLYDAMAEYQRDYS